MSAPEPEPLAAAPSPAPPPAPQHLGGPLNPTDASTDDLGVRKLIIQSVVGLIGLLAILFVVGLLWYQPLVAAGKLMVATLGGPGLLVVFFLLDGLWLPIPHETFSGLALVGGMDFWAVGAWASAGSLVGGPFGFAIARRIGHMAWFQRFMRGRGRQAFAIVERYGTTGLAIGAITPLPYVWTTWAAGALGMPWRTFLPVSLLRIPRILFYLWLMEQGFLRL